MHAQWLPGSRHILTVAAHSLRVCIWSLLSPSKQIAASEPGKTRKVVAMRPSVRFIVRVNRNARDYGMCFSPSGEWLAVLERREHTDFVCVFDCTQESIPLVKVGHPVGCLPSLALFVPLTCTSLFFW